MPLLKLFKSVGKGIYNTYHGIIEGIILMRKHKAERYSR